MSKRSTTARARKQRDESLKHRRSKAEQEQYYQRIILIVAGVGLAITLLVVGYAVIFEVLIQPEQAISEVNGAEIKTKDFQERVKTERWFKANEIRSFYAAFGADQTQQQYATDLVTLRDPGLFGGQVLDDMELQVLLEQEANQRGIEIDSAAVESAVDQYIAPFLVSNLTPSPSPSPTLPTTPTSTPLITATASHTPTVTNTPEPTLQPTAFGCTPEQTDCPTVTPAPTTTPSPTPTVTPEQSATPTPSSTPVAPDDIRATISDVEREFYNNAEELAEVDRDAVRDIFYLRALRAALRDDVTKDLETREVWVNARHILISVPNETGAYSEELCNSEEWATYKADAEQILAALQAGEPFASLAVGASGDTGSGQRGGMLGWAKSSTYVPTFKEAVETADIGALVGPICSQFGFHVIQVLEREVRPIPNNELDDLRNQEYQEWEGNLFADAEIQRRDDWEDRVPEDPSYLDLLGDLFG